MERDSEKNICSVNYCIELVPYDVFYSPLVDFKCVVRIFISVQTSILKKMSYKFEYTNFWCKNILHDLVMSIKVFV